MPHYVSNIAISRFLLPALPARVLRGRFLTSNLIVVQAPQVRSYYDTAPATLRGHSNLDMSQELDTEAGGLLSPSRLEAKVLQMCAGKQGRL